MRITIRVIRRLIWLSEHSEPGSGAAASRHSGLDHGAEEELLANPVMANTPLVSDSVFRKEGTVRLCRRKRLMPIGER